jgi:hypothetical protein
MKKTLTILMLLLLGVSALFSQRETYNWCFGSSCWLSFNYTPPRFVSKSSMYAEEGCAAISDAKGKLLFYTNGIEIWAPRTDSSHYVLANASSMNGTKLNGHSSSTQVGVIIPKPGQGVQKFLYYVFTTDADGSGNGLQYTVVNTDPNKATWQIDVYKNNNVYEKNIPINKSSTEKITAVLAKDGVNYWIIAHEWDNNTFCAYKLNAAGIDVNNPVKSSVGSIHAKDPAPPDGRTQYQAHGYMKVSPDGSTIALTIFRTGKVELFHFDNVTGAVTPYFSLNEPRFNNAYGIEFSANSKMVYISCIDEKPSKIYQINLEKIGDGSDVNLINANIREVGSSSINGIYFAAMQLGPDAKIYISIQDGYYIGVINKPETEGAGCNFVENGIAVADGTVPMKGLPTFIQSFFKPPSGITAIPNPLCEGETLSLSTVDVPGAIYTWKGPDGFSSTAVSAEIRNIKRAAGGKYFLTVQLGTQFSYDTVDITVYPSPIVDIDNHNPGDTIFICQGSQATVTATAQQYDILKWSSGETIPTISVNTTGMYTITVETNNGCTRSDSVYVEVIDTVNFEVKAKEGTFRACDGQELTLIAEPKNYSYTDVSYEWIQVSSGNVVGTGDTCKVSQTGTYTVKVTEKKFNMCESFRTITIEIGSLSPKIIAVGDSIICNDNPVYLALDNSYDSYQWLKDGIKLDGDTTKFLTASTPGNYSCTVKDNLGCEGTASFTVRIIDIDAIFAALDNIFLGRVYYSTTGGDIVITVPNNSGFDLKIKSITLKNGKDITVTPNSPMTILAGQSTDFAFKFSPKDIAEYLDEIIIEIEEPCSGKYEGRITGYGIADLLVYLPPVTKGKIGDKALPLPIMGKLMITDDKTATCGISKIGVKHNAAAYNPTSVTPASITMTKVFDETLYELNTTLEFKDPVTFSKNPTLIAELKGQLGFGEEGTPVSFTNASLNCLLLNVIIQNGTFSFFGVCQPDLLKVRKNAVTFAKIAPNPTSGEIKVTVANTEKGTHDITFINAIGSRMLATTWTKTGDNYSDDFTMDVSSLPAGVYQVIIRTTTEVLTVPLVIVK